MCDRGAPNERNHLASSADAGSVAPPMEARMCDRVASDYMGGAECAIGVRRTSAIICNRPRAHVWRHPLWRRECVRGVHRIAWEAQNVR